MSAPRAPPHARPRCGACPGADPSRRRWAPRPPAWRSARRPSAPSSGSAASSVSDRHRPHALDAASSSRCVVELLVDVTCDRRGRWSASCLSNVLEDARCCAGARWPRARAVALGHAMSTSWRRRVISSARRLALARRATGVMSLARSRGEPAVRRSRAGSAHRPDRSRPARPSTWRSRAPGAGSRRATDARASAARTPGRARSRRWLDDDQLSVGRPELRGQLVPPRGVIDHAQFGRAQQTSSAACRRPRRRPGRCGTASSTPPC